MDRVIESLARIKALQFKQGFIDFTRQVFERDEGTLIHAGEFGAYRERMLKDLLSSFLPLSYAFGEGFLVNRNSENSTQCDVVIYDKWETPKLENYDLRRFFPIETVYGVGEVKSKQTVSQLKKSLKKLMEVKKLRNYEPSIKQPIKPNNLNLDDNSRYLEVHLEEYGEEYKSIDYWNPNYNEHQNVVSFLVCESIDLGKKEMTDLANEIYEPSMDDISKRHNFILSLNDGLLSYYTMRAGEERKPYVFPTRGDISTGIRFVEPTDNGDHIIAFLSGLASALSQTCIYSFDASSYMEKYNEKHIPMR
jgi:hypothetical protein